MRRVAASSVVANDGLVRRFEADAGGANVTMGGSTIYNMLDQDDLAQAVMSNPSTKGSIVNIIRAQKREIKQILGVN